MSHDRMNTAAVQTCQAYINALEQRAKYLPAIEELIRLKVNVDLHLACVERRVDSVKQLAQIPSTL